MPNEAQQVSILSYVDFTGGMNSAVPPTSLQDNEYQLIRNMEFNFNKLCTRGGLSAPLVSFPASINGMFYDEASGETLVVLKNKLVYKLSSNGTSTKVGETTGIQKPTFCTFDGKIFIASGGKLQYYDYVKNNITTITTSYLCDTVFERFGRLVTTASGDDNLYYSAVGDPYETKIIETTITDENGKHTITSETLSGYTGTSTTETTAQSTSTTTTTIKDSVTVAYKSGTANVLDGKNPVAGTTTSKSESHTVKIEQGYKNSELISTVYYLDGQQSTTDEINNLSYQDFVFGTIPTTSTYLPVSDKEDTMFGSVYRDIKDTSGNTTRTYYVDGSYDVYDNNINIVYKLDRVTSSKGSVTSFLLTVPYLKISFKNIPDEAINEEAIIYTSPTTKTNITGGTQEVTKYTVAKLISNNNGVTATTYFKTKTVQDTTTVATAPSTASGSLYDNKGYKVTSVYPNIKSSTIKDTIKNSDGTTTTYETVVDKYGKVSKITRTVEESTSNTTVSSQNYTITDTKVAVATVDDGSKTVVTTTTTKKTDNNVYASQYVLFTVTLSTTESTSTKTSSNSTTVKTTYNSGWTDDSNDDSTSKWLEIGYKDDGDIIKVIPISGDIAIFKSNGRVYTVSSEYPNWTVQQIAEHTDIVDSNAIVGVGSNVAFMTNKGLKTLQTTAMYGNFTTDELARKINRSVAESIINPALYNLIRKRQLVIVPNTGTDENRKQCYVYQYDIGAGVKMDFAYPIYDMQDSPNGVLVASGQSIYLWSFDYDDDNGTPIEQEIVSKKYATSNRLYTRMVDIGVEGEAGRLVTMKWANKTVNYAIPEKRRMINVFSVCRDSVFGLYTTAKISLEYIKLYIFEQ